MAVQKRELRLVNPADKVIHEPPFKMMLKEHLSSQMLQEILRNLCIFREHAVSICASFSKSDGSSLQKVITSF